MKLSVISAAAVVVLCAVAPVTAQETKQNPTAQVPPNPSKQPYEMPKGSNSASEGASTGEMGANAPAGNPSDPNTSQNQQPGPSVKNPTDPAAASKPAAREPTAPPASGSSQ